MRMYYTVNLNITIGSFPAEYIIVLFCFVVVVIVVCLFVFAVVRVVSIHMDDVYKR